MGWGDFVAEGQHRKLGRTDDGEIEWNRLPFDAPLWILFSSGTTGRPKCAIPQKICAKSRLTLPIQTHRASRGWYAHPSKKRIRNLWRPLS